MTDIKYRLFYILILLIGLNFQGSAILLSYILIVFTFFCIKSTRKVPKNAIIVLLLPLSIDISAVMQGTDGIVYQFLKSGVYTNIYFSFYLLAMKCCSNKLDMENMLRVFSNCIFFFSFGNMIHFILNMFITDMTTINLGHRVLNDFWSGGTVPTTIVLGWGCFLMPLLIYYVERYMSEKIKFFVSLALMICYVIFSFQIATRLGIANAVLILIIYYILKIQQKEIVINLKKLIKLGIVGILVVLLGIKIVPLILESNLAVRMSGESISLFSGNGRFEANIYLLSHWSEALFGGSYFTNQYGLQQHNMLLQIYDLYGIIPFFILLLVFINVIKKAVNMYCKKDLCNSSRRFCFLIVFSLFLYSFEEPAISSNYIITSMFFGWLGFSTVVNTFRCIKRGI